MRFLAKLSLMILLVWAMDSAFSSFLNTGRPLDYRAFIESKLSYQERPGYDVIAIGDSHTADSVNPRTFQHETGMSLFNFGIYHAAPYELLFLSRDVLKRTAKAPKIVLLGTNPVMFMRPKSAGKYTPLFLDSPLLHAQLIWSTEQFSPASFSSAGPKLDLLSPAWDHFWQPSAGRPVTRNVAWVDNGYIANTRADLSKDSPLPSITPALQDQMQAFEDTVDLFQAAGVRVMVIHPPMYRDRYLAYTKMAEFTQFRSFFNDLAARKSVVQFNADNEIGNAGLNEDHFLNVEHVCLPGAELFSQSLAAFVRSLSP